MRDGVFMQGKLVTIFGGSGFLGRYVAQELLAMGVRIRVACRNPSNAIYIKPLGNLGQVQLVAADVRKPGSVKRAVADADAVVNLVGSFADMDAIQNIGARNIARVLLRLSIFRPLAPIPKALRNMERARRPVKPQCVSISRPPPFCAPRLSLVVRISS
jgi:uncharacterized protein YbjT (DUF2867 family)